MGEDAGLKKIGVFGAGTMGMSLARMLYLNGYEIVVWSATDRDYKQCKETRRHRNLEGMVIPEEIRFTREIAEACEGADMILSAVASVYVRETIAKARPYIPDGQIIADVAKGLEKGTMLTMSEVIEDELKKDGKHDHVRVVALSGPTHAEEVAKDLPTTIVSASTDMAAAEEVQDVFMNTCMRVYTNADVRGVELCGALKNVISLACGIATGIGCGDNARAALITRGMAEMTRLGLAAGCMEQTFYGLAGIGDLVVTATSQHSRNNRCGQMIGRGYTVEEATKEVGQVVEGLNALPAAIEMGRKLGVELPITEMLSRIVNEGLDPAEAVGMLMTREKKSEVSEDAIGKFFRSRRRAERRG